MATPKGSAPSSSPTAPPPAPTINPNPYDAERQAVMGYFEDIFVAPDGSVDAKGKPNPFIPFEIPNRRIDQPSGNWARVSIQGGSPFGRNANSNATRSANILTVEIFMPEKKGTKVSRDAALIVRAAFHYRQLLVSTGILRFWEVGLRDVGSNADGFAKANIEVPFWTDTNAAGTLNAQFNDPTNATRGYILLPNFNIP